MPKTTEATEDDDAIGFRFSKIDDYLLDSLRTSTLYFPQPHELNDPYDCFFAPQDYTEQAKKIKDAERKRKVEVLIENFKNNHEKNLSMMGVCSFCGADKTFPLQNLLMWSHYADKHKGLCITYRIPLSFLNEHKFGLVGSDTVSYEDEWVTNWLMNGDLEENGNGASENLAIKILTSKSHGWAYEKEWRIIRKLDKECAGRKNKGECKFKNEGDSNEMLNKNHECRRYLSDNCKYLDLKKAGIHILKIYFGLNAKDCDIKRVRTTIPPTVKIFKMKRNGLFRLIEEELR